MALKINFTVISVAICMILYISENARVQATECKTSLNSFGFKGEMHIDTHKFKVADPKEIKFVVGYRDYVDFMDDRIFSAANNIVDNYCNVVVPLLDSGFSGYIAGDAVHESSKEETKTLATEYKAFVKAKLAKLPKKSDGTPDTFVFEVVYEYASTLLGETEEGKKCREENEGVKLNLNGNFLNDLIALRAVPKFGKDNVDNYELFLEYAKKYVLFTHRNSLLVFCDLVDALEDAKYTGKLEEDKGKPPSDEGLKEEYALYEIYLNQVNLDHYTAADVKAPENYLLQFGVVKLGGMLY